MMTLLYIFLFFLIIFFISQIGIETYVKILRSQGLYPQRGQATTEDVNKLLLNGKKILAMRAYREIHGASLKEAKRKIKEIEKTVLSD